MKDEKKKLSFDLTYKFTHDIERIWLLMRDSSLVTIINDDKILPISISYSRETWKKGSKYEGVIYDKYSFKAETIESINLPHKKKLVTKYTYEDGTSSILKFNLYRITENNTCVMYSQIIFSSFEVMDKIFINDYKENSIAVLNKIEKILADTSFNLFQFESCIITAKLEDIWSIITNWSKLKMIAPLMRYECPDDPIISKINDEKTICVNNGSAHVKVKVIIFEHNPKRNKWIYAFSVIDGEPKVPKQDVIVTLLRINFEECQISILHDFKEKVTQRIVENLSKDKKYVLNSLKDYVENYECN